MRDALGEGSAPLELCAGRVLGTQRRERVALDAEQLLDRQLGAEVIALAEVVLEQPCAAVEQVARGPALVLVLLPELEVRVDQDGVGK